MPSKRKSWRDNLTGDKDLPKIENIPPQFEAKWGTGTFVIARPREVDAIMRRVPEGNLITINEIRKRLAKKHGTTTACPITTGIFAWIAAHCADENAQAGNDATPYWRTLKAGGELNPKYPGGVDALKLRLTSEGHVFEQRGKRVFVKGFGK